MSLIRYCLIGALIVPSLVCAEDTEFAARVMGPADLVLEVEINGVRQAQPAITRYTASDGLLVRAADLAAWGIQWDAGDEYVAVTHIEGLRARVDFSRQVLFVTAVPSLLPTADVKLDDRAANDAAPSAPGGFLGYDVLGAREDGTRAAAARLEAGAFAGAWSTNGTWQLNAREGVLGTRLDTTLARDWPDRMRSLRVGDTITTPGYWGAAARIGGFHWGTDFGSRPDFITFPLPAVRGEAVVPSTVDVYVNGALRARREVAPGAFSFRDLPVVSGSGDVRLVVRDSLGREQTIEQPYFATTSLLRAGLSAYSVEAGAVRRDYGLESFAYGRPVAVGGWRRGLSDALTAELRGELLEHQQTMGAGLVTAVVPGVTLSGSLAHSEASNAGTLAQLGIDFSRQAFNAGARVRAATAEYRQLGMARDENAARRAVDAQLGWTAGRVGSFGMVYAYRDIRERDDVRLVSLTFGRSLGSLGYLGAFATYDLSHRGDSQAILALTRPIGERTSTRLSASSNGGRVGGGVAINRSLPRGEGAGFHVEAEDAQLGRMAAGAALRREAITLSADIERVEHENRYTASARGGFVLMGGHLAAVRDVDAETSFAVVEVPSLGGVPIYHDHHRVATTDANGFAVLPGLRPYEANRLQIDPNDLPIDTTMAASEYTVRPYRRGGVRVRFPVAERGGAVVRLMRESNEPVAAGARVRVGDGHYVVASEGAVFISGQHGEVELEASWPGHRCHAQVTIPAGSVLPDLGAVICREAL